MIMPTRIRAYISEEKGMIKQAIDICRRYLDLVALAGCTAIGIGITGLSVIAGIAQYGMGSAFLLACLTYVGLRRRLPLPPSESHLHRPRSRTALHRWFSRVPMKLSIGLGWVLISTVVFLIALFGAIYTGLAHPYDRPPIHFALITAAYTTVIVDALAARHRSAILVGLCKLVLVSIAFRAIRFLSFATIPGIDVHFHVRLAGRIASSGYIPSYEAVGSKYVATPIWHLLVATTEVIFDVSTEYAVFGAIVVVFTVGTILLAFAITRQITGSAEPALLTALFIAISDMFIVRGVTSITPSSLVIIYTFLILLLALVHLRKYQHLAVFLTFAAAFLTHQLSAFALLIVLIMLIGIAKLYRLGSTVYAGHRSLYAPHALFAITALVFIWMLIPSGDLSFFDRMIQRLVRTGIRIVTASGGNDGSGYASAFGSHSFLSNILYSLGYSLLLYIGVVGALIWVHPTNQSRTQVTYAATAFVFFSLIYPMTYIGLDLLLIPHRLIVFLEIFLAVFASVAVWTVYQAIDSRLSHIALVVVICLLIAAMLTTPYVNRGNPVYGEERVERTELTHAEVDGLLWAVKYGDQVYTDPSVYSSILRDQTTDTTMFESSTTESYPPDLSFETDSITAIRTAMIDQPIEYSGTFGTEARTISGRDVQDEQRDSHRVYDNGAVINYAR